MNVDAVAAQIKKRNYPAAIKEFCGEILLVGINYDILDVMSWIVRVEQADLLSISDTIILKQRRTYSMREVKAVKINAADFAPYGTFCSMTEPEGYPLEGEIHKFYPDRISGTCVGTMAFSPIEVRKDERIVKMAEYHTTTWEGIVALDDDMHYPCCICFRAEHRFRTC